MNKLLLHYSSISGFIPAIAAMFRFRNSPAMYRPFFIFVWVGAFFDTISTICIYIFRNNAAISNVYVLAESLLLLWIFYRWNGSQRKRKYLLFGIAAILIWILDNLVFHNMVLTFNSSFRICYCLWTIFFSIDLINRLIIFERKKLIRNPMFLISISFVILFSYKAYVESFYMFGFSFSNEFYRKVFSIFKIINVISNLVFTIAIICIPKKQEFYMR